MVEFFLFCCSSQKIKIKINKFQRFKIITSPTKHKYRYFESFQEWHDKHLGLLIVFPYSVSMSMCIILYMHSLLVSCWIELYEINIGCSNILFSVFYCQSLLYSSCAGQGLSLMYRIYNSGLLFFLDQRSDINTDPCVWDKWGW